MVSVFLFLSLADWILFFMFRYDTFRDANGAMSGWASWGTLAGLKYNIVNLISRKLSRELQCYSVVFVVVLALLLFGTSRSWIGPFFHPLRGPEHEGPLAFDRECQAVHIMVSPWRWYLDIDTYNREMRIARMWLNA